MLKKLKFWPQKKTPHLFPTTEEERWSEELRKATNPSAKADRVASHLGRW